MATSRVGAFEARRPYTAMQTSSVASTSISAIVISSFHCLKTLWISPVERLRSLPNVFPSNIREADRL